MNKYLSVVTLLILFAAAQHMAAAQESRVPQGIILAFKAGNAEELSGHFQSNVELILLDQEDVYSRSQAEQIIRKFFAEHPPESFKIIFEGGPESSPYAIGSLRTSKSTYRIYILLKKQDATPLIHQLRIEEEEQDA